MSNHNKKVLAIVDQDPDLKKWFERQQDIFDRAKSELMFWDKKVQAMKAEGDVIAKRYDNERNEFWREFEDYLKTRGLLPESYNKKTGVIGFDGGALYMRDKCDHDHDEDDIPVGAIPVPAAIGKALMAALFGKGDKT